MREIGVAEFYKTPMKDLVAKVRAEGKELAIGCADCHMLYSKEGGVKVSDHWVRSPLFNISQACQQCHRWSEEDLRQRVTLIQDRTAYLLKRSETAILDAIDAVRAAMAAEVADDQLKQARHLHRRAQMRWDFIASENNMGFHSPQEAARWLGESIDFARQAQIAALRLRVGKAKLAAR